MTGGLDRRIHYFRVDRGSFSLVNTLTTAAPVLAMELSKNGECLAFGMNNLLSIYRRAAKLTASKAVVGTGKELRHKLHSITHREANSTSKRAEVTSKHVEQVCGFLIPDPV